MLSLLLAISGGIGAWFAWRDTVAGVEALQRAQAEALATRIERDAAAIAQPLRWIVDDPALAHGDASEALQIELLRAMRRQGAIDELRWVDAAGRERLALSRIAPDVVDSGRDWSGDARVAAARRDGEFIDRVRFADDGEPHVTMVLAAPRGGPVLIAEIGLRPVLAATALQIAPAGLAYVVDAEGRLLSHPDVGLVLRQTILSSLAHVRRALAAAQPMSMRDERDVAGRAVFAAAAPIPRLGWTVFVEQDRGQALAPVWRVLGQSALLVAFGVLVAVVASAWLARRLTQPIRELQVRAQAIGRGRFDERLDLRTGDELQTLAEAFERMASDLRSSYATLEARVAERTRELADANEAKGRFLAAASHDLRQPVHALGLFVGQLRATVDADRRRELIGHIEASVAAFEALLASLLDLSRLDAGVVPVHREAVDLAALIARVGAGVQAEAQRKGLRLRVTPRRVWVDSDAVLLERIVLNLVGNAVRYTERGSVRLAVVRHGDDATLRGHRHGHRARALAARLSRVLPRRRSPVGRCAGTRARAGDRRAARAPARPPRARALAARPGHLLLADPAERGGSRGWYRGATGVSGADRTRGLPRARRRRRRGGARGDARPARAVGLPGPAGGVGRWGVGRLRRVAAAPRDRRPSTGRRRRTGAGAAAARTRRRRRGVGDRDRRDCGAAVAGRARRRLHGARQTGSPGAPARRRPSVVPARRRGLTGLRSAAGRARAASPRAPPACGCSRPGRAALRSGAPSRCVRPARARRR